MTIFPSLHSLKVIIIVPTTHSALYCLKQTDILRSVFITYFRVLKRATSSPLLPTVLRGLARSSRPARAGLSPLLTLLFATQVHTVHQRRFYPGHHHGTPAAHWRRS